jgi:hypothetical protein
LISGNIKIKIQRTVILPAVFYVCVKMLIVLREEHRLRAPGNMVLEKIFGSKGRLRGDCTVRNLLSQLTKYYSGDQIKKHKMGEACGTYGGEKSCIEGPGGKISERDNLKNLGVDGNIIYIISIYII